MALKRAYANIELADGTVHEDVRITLADRLDLERTMRARNWDQSAAFTIAAYLGWRALTRTGQFTGSWDEFLAATVDAQLDDATEADADPTPPARES